MDKKLFDAINALMPMPETIEDSFVFTQAQIDSIKIVKDCDFNAAVKKGFSGTSERWEEIKVTYAVGLLIRHGLGVEVDFTNILFDGQGMQDTEGDWHK
jgi:hypothetical protein